jgi:hypothetical protein
MATHRPIDVLPDRTADTLAGWLQARPGVQIVCRDQTALAPARTASAPAPRTRSKWRTGGTCGPTSARRWTRRSALIVPGCASPRSRPLPPPPRPEADPAPPRELLDAHGHERPLVVRTQERYDEVQALRASGLSLNAISRTLGLTFRTTRRFANAASVKGVAGRRLQPGQRAGRVQALPDPPVERGLHQRRPAPRRTPSPGLEGQPAHRPGLPAPVPHPAGERGRATTSAQAPARGHLDHDRPRPSGRRGPRPAQGGPGPLPGAERPLPSRCARSPR